jgi:anti-sigma regulatory factor (Ser/Thr protein kinase)
MSPEAKDLTRFEYDVPLQGIGTSSKEARQIVSEVLASWSLSRLTADAHVVVAELVTNALEAAPLRPMRLHIRLEPATDTVYIGVQDRSGRLPFAPKADLLGESGRGLLLIASFSDESGTTMLDIGKIVWARFKVN